MPTGCAARAKTARLRGLGAWTELSAELSHSLSGSHLKRVNKSTTQQALRTTAMQSRGRQPYSGTSVRRPATWSLAAIVIGGARLSVQREVEGSKSGKRVRVRAWLFLRSRSRFSSFCCCSCSASDMSIERRASRSSKSISISPRRRCDAWPRRATHDACGRQPHGVRSR
eukprot:3438742-Pleurochrysis_carterae.AAC.1